MAVVLDIFEMSDSPLSPTVHLVTSLRSSFRINVFLSSSTDSSRLRDIDCHSVFRITSNGCSHCPATVEEKRWRLLREQVYIRTHATLSLKDFYARFPITPDLTEDQLVNRSAGETASALSLLAPSSPIEQFYKTAACVSEFGDPIKASEVIELGLARELQPMYS
jgi:hypothetical protein